MDKEFYCLTVQETEEALETDKREGLDQREVLRRQRIYGENRLPEDKSGTILGLFLSQFNDFMVMVLLAATLISTLLGQLDDALVILAIVILNAILGFVQEYRAERALKDLKRLSAPTTFVRREGETRTVEVLDLVPGDLILVEAGQYIPADARIISSSALTVDESSLTGESQAVKKDPSSVEGEVPLGDRSSMIFKSTLVVQGRGEALVTTIGSKTEMGHIAHLIKEEEEGPTPLQRRLKILGYWLVSLCLVACGLVVGVGLWQGKSIYQMFMAGVSLAVAAIPEGLPAIVTLSLALGVSRMIKKKAIVRRLPAVETLGCATVICADKTGTLTQNKMSLQSIYFNGKTYRHIDSGLTLPLLAGLLCNNCIYRGEELVGDPTEMALYRAAEEMGITSKGYRREEEIPFSSERKMMSVIVSKRGIKEIYSKGAPKQILDRCTTYLYRGKIYPLTREMKERFLGVARGWGKKALRVLALAYSSLPRDGGKKERDLTFIGLIGIIDPPRPEVLGAIRSCEEAGILPVMITGDHRDTAVAIGRKVGLIKEREEVMEGDELKKIDDANLPSRIKGIRIFARVTPKEKLRLVKAYQSKREVVAMTGDGINDAPAVKAADIGIAMGRIGTDVTREVSSLVLADDNFATIVAAIEEGRGIYENIRKFIRYLLSCNIGEILLVLLAMILGMPLPLIPIQILWVNLVTDGLPALALGLEPTEEGIMKKRPRDSQETIFAHGLGARILIHGTAIGICTLSIFLFSLSQGKALEGARTMAFTSLVIYQLFFVFSCRRERRPLWRVRVLENPYLVVAVFISFLLQLSVIYHPTISSLFTTTPLYLQDWLLILLVPLFFILLMDGIEHSIGGIFFFKIREILER